MNLLALLHEKEISTEEAQRIFDDLLKRIQNGEVQTDWRDEFELSNYEATAYLHEANLDDLVKLRYEGWPTSCCRCHLPLDYRLYGWWFVHSDDGVARLRHIKCPTKP